MSATIVNVSRGRRKTSSGDEKTMAKRVRRQGLVRAFGKTDGHKAKSVSQNVTMAKDQQGGKKRKGKVPDARAKEPPSPLRRTRSRTVGALGDNNPGPTGGSPIGGKSAKHIGLLGNRKRGREAPPLGDPTPKKSSARIRNKFLPHLAKITEEKSSSDEEAPAIVDRGTPRSIGIPLRKTVTTVRKVVAKEQQKEGRERKTVKTASAKKLSTIVVNVARAKTSPGVGLQELRRSTRQNAQKQSNPNPNPSPNPNPKPPVKPKVESADTNEEMVARESNGTGADGGNVRVTRSKSTSNVNALRVAEDATGFVRTALNAVAEATRMREQQSKKAVGEASSAAAEAVSKDDNLSNSNGSSRSTRSRTSMTAEKLIQELDSFRLASQGQGGVDMKEKLRKGITRLTRATSRLSKQQGTEGSLKKASAPTKLPRVANQENLPKATESALVRRVKSDIEDHAKRYGLLEQERPPLPGRSARKSGLKTPGMEQQGSEPEGCSQSPNEWTPEQEMALQNAYVSVKPAADFWYHISKKVPGRTAEECFNKFYAGHPTPPVAQRPKRQTGNVAEDADFLSNPKAKGGKQRLLEAHRTIRNILRKQQVDDEGYEADAFVALERPDVVENVLNREEAEEAVIFKVTEVPTCTPPANSESKLNKRFDNIVIGGLSAGVRLPSDKENRNVNAAVGSGKGRMLADSPAQLCSPEVLKKVKDPKQLDKYIDHLHQRHTRGPRPGSQKVVKKNNVYLHSKDALDFGENTLSAIQRAKEELRNVFLKSGAGANFLDIVGPGKEEEEEDEDEDEHDGEFSSDCDG